MDNSLQPIETPQRATTKLASLIAERRVSQVWLAKAAGYGNSAVINELCSGKQRMTLVRAIRIADALGVSVGDVMEEAPPDDARCPTCTRPLPSQLRQRPLEPASNH